MCTEAIVNGKYVESQGQLAYALGCTVADLVISELYINSRDAESGRAEGACLCPIDCEGTANKLGFEFTQHGWDAQFSGEVEFTTPGPPS